MNLPTIERHLALSMVHAYLAASGDDNPIHTDVAKAVQLGLAGNPVPGMLVVGLVTSHLLEVLGGTHLPAVVSRFVAPVLVGAVVEIKPRIMRRHADGSAQVVRAIVSSEGKLSAIVEATLPPSDARLQEM